MTKKPLDTDLTELITVLHELHDALSHISKRVRMRRLWWTSLLQGIFRGIGMLLAFAVVVPLLLWFLHSIDWVPIIGDFVVDVAGRVEQQAQTRLR